MGNDPAERWNELGAFIREQRNTARLSLRRLSELAGISNPYLSQIERGLRRPSAEILQQIAKALRISAETLYVQAGILDPPDGSPDLARQILSDPHLSEEQKQALVRIYLSFRARASRAGSGAAAEGPPDAPEATGGGPAPVEAGPGGRRPAPVGFRRHATAGRPLVAHLAPGPAGHRRRRRHERLRARAGHRAGPQRCRLRRLHPGLVGRPPAHGGRGARPAHPPRAGRAARPPGQGAAARGGRRVHRRGAGPHDRAPRAGPRGSAGDEAPPFEAVHANYWLSGLAGHAIKHELDLPLVSTFHTLDRVKAEAGPEEVEADTAHRRGRGRGGHRALLGRRAGLVHGGGGADRRPLRRRPLAHRRVAPGVDHAFFGPGHRPQARRALGLPADGTLLLFVGRIQPLKCADLAVRTLAELPGTPAPTTAWSWWAAPAVPTATRPTTTSSPGRRVGVSDRVTLVPPSPTSCSPPGTARADACLVPSRSESFGLVALEAAACGTPVVARRWAGSPPSSTTGGPASWWRTRPGRLRDCVRAIVSEPLLAERLSTASVLRARRYTWRQAAATLRTVHDELLEGRLVECS